MSRAPNSHKTNHPETGNTREAVVLFVASYLTVAVVAIGSFLALA